MWSRKVIGFRTKSRRLSAAKRQKSPSLSLSNRRASFEPLESRLVLAALLPSQVVHAYGIDHLNFGSTPGDGAGQTIAIIDPGDDATLVNNSDPNFSTSDLHQFDVLEGLPDPVFTVVGENGGARPAYIGIASSTESGSLVTITTTTPHGLSTGNSVVIAEDGSYDGSFSGITKVDATTFTYTDPNNSNLASATPPHGTINNPVSTGETTLDVEWSHAMAPGANIILIEMQGFQDSDIGNAVGTAKSLGASVVSMSFGKGEFGQEKTGPDPENDSIFQTAGVTFIASTGDNGVPGGYPAFSPDVLAVGATNLNLNPDNTYNNETGWSNPAAITNESEVGNVVSITTAFPTGLVPGNTFTIAGDANGYNGFFTAATTPTSTTFTFTDSTTGLPTESAGGGTVYGSSFAPPGTNLGGGGGGKSTVESEPAYQNGVQSSTTRETPDISFVGGALTPVETLDTDGGASPTLDIFSTIGTSVSAPCWAGLMAIADQGRALVAGNGSTAFDSEATGANSLQTALYGLTAADFHDVTLGYNGFFAGTGYDLVTGLGSPVANFLVPDLAGTSIDYTVPSAGSPHQLVLRKNGINVELLDNGSVVGTAPVATISDVNITDPNSSNDSLLVDYAFDGMFAAQVSFDHTGDSGYDTVAVNAPNGPGNTISVSEDPDVAGAGSIVVDGTTQTINFQSVSEVDVNAGSGGDAITLNGQGGMSGLTKLDIVGGTGNDTLAVDSSNGLFAMPADGTSGIFFDGGGGFDKLALQQTGGSPQTGDTYTVGPNPGEGSDVIVGPSGTQSVYFQHLAPVLDNVLATTATVNATPADNAINYTEGPGGGIFGGDTTGLVTIDNQESYEFSNKTNLTINGLAGSDEINLNDPTPPTGLTGSITVNGGDPTASDTLIVNGTTGADEIDYLPTGPDNGSVTVTNLPTVIFTTMESVVINGQGGGDTLTYTSPGNAVGSVLTYTPGANADSGTITGRQATDGPLPPLSFSNLSFGGGVVFATANEGPTDDLTINGTAAADVFYVTSANGGTVYVTNTNALPDAVTLPIQTPSVNQIALQGLDGDDTFNLAGALPYTSTLVDGGNPSASDIVNLTGATTSVTVNLADSTLPTDTTITGYGGTVTLTGVEVANLDAAGFGMTVNGTAHDDVITYTPTGASAGTFQLAGLNTAFNFTTVTGTFLITGGTGAVGTVGNTDEVIVQGTNSRDLFQIDQGRATVQVFAYNVNPLKTVLLDPTIQVLTALGLAGQDTFQVTPAAGVPAFTGDTSGINNLLINVDGGSGPSGENNALVVQGTGGATLPTTSFVVVNRGADYTSGTVRVFQNPTGAGPAADPDINYVNVQVVSPNVANAPAGTLNPGQPNLLIMGPDLYEPNETQANAAFVGSGATLQIQHASIFPNYQEFPGVPSDNDYYRVVAQTTGTLDFQVYFNLFDPTLLPAGGNLDLQVLDANGHVIGSAPGTFGAVGATADARVRIPAVAGQSYFLRVYGQPPAAGQSAVINGYNVTIIDTAPPVPFDLELSRSVPPTVAGSPDTGDLPPTAPNDDTGRSQFDNVTDLNRPTIYVRLGDGVLLNDLPGNGTTDTPPAGVIPIHFSPNATTAGFRVAIFDGNDSQNPVGFATQVTGFPGLYQYTFTTPLADGLHHITAEVQMVDPATPRQTGFGDRSLSLDITIDTAPPPTFFGTQASTIDGIDPAHSDTGVQSYPATFVDRVTSDTHTGFWGTAEANAIVRVYSDQNHDGVVDAGDLLLGETTAIPIDGTNAFPNGQWNLTTTVDLNDPAFFPHDGTRNLLVTGEDLAGNVSAPDALKIFIDTQGPQVSNVTITGFPTFNLFALKPQNSSQGPTPLVNSLTISIVDNPDRDTINFPAYVALLAAAAANPGDYVVQGDASGIIAIQQVIVTNNPTVNGQPATATIQLIFASPLPDDRYTLTINATDVVDPAGNMLDGESNAQQPSGADLPQRQRSAGRGLRRPLHRR